MLLDGAIMVLNGHSSYFIKKYQRTRLSFFEDELQGIAAIGRKTLPK